MHFRLLLTRETPDDTFLARLANNIVTAFHEGHEVHRSVVAT